MLNKFFVLQLRVLLVEDSIPILKMMKRWLEANNCIVITAMNGLLGLKALTADPSFDILITDFVMVRRCDDFALDLLLFTMLSFLLYASRTHSLTLSLSLCRRSESFPVESVVVVWSTITSVHFEWKCHS